MKPKQVAISILLIFFAIIAYDVWLYSDGIAGNSITQVIIAAGEKSPLVPWFIGFIMGSLTFHFWDSYKEPRE